MGNFRSDSRGGNRNRDNDRSGSRGGFSRRPQGGFNDRNRSRGGFNNRSDRRTEMHDVTCDKCGKDCQVPFKPSGGKPVLCSDCFRNSDNSGPRTRQSSFPSISPEQFNQINEKLDKILNVLSSLEIIEDDEDLDEGEDDSEDESEEDSENDSEEIKEE